MNPSQPIEPPLPQPTRETEGYWQAVRERRLVVQRCTACGRMQFPPRAFCTECLSQTLEWSPATGGGHIYTYTVCRTAPSPAFETRLPYVVAVVELDEGVRMLSDIVVVDPARVAVGMRVQVCFESNDTGNLLPRFSPVE